MAGRMGGREDVRIGGWEDGRENGTFGFLKGFIIYPTS